MQNDRAELEMKIESAELRRLLGNSPVLERLATGFGFTEGPVWFPDGNYLIFSDIPNTTLHRWDEQDGVSVFRKPSGFANGNTRDLEGRLLTCEHSNRRVSRTEHDGTITVIASHYEGKRLNSPNDIVVKSDGMIYFTDPTYGLDPREGDGGRQELEWQGVYRVAPDGSELTLLVNDFTAPNGLVFSPDERQLYVDDSEDMFVKVFDVQSDGTLDGGKIIAQSMGGHADRPGIPDGMKVDVEGRLWATGPGGVWVMEPDGRLIGVLPVPEVAANLNWGGPDRRTLYITASTSLYRVRVNVAGAPER
jgi:gluconolactonase